MIEITFPDSSVRKYTEGTTVFEVAKSISEGLARNVISAKYNDQKVETTTELSESGKLVLYTWNDIDGKQAFWHSTAHVLAQALEILYPEVKLTIGPAIEEGFYYDADFGDKSITEEDLEEVEKKMLELARQSFEFKMRKSTKKDALDYYKQKNNPYKVELIENLEEGTITFCDHSDFTDLCRGGHIPNTSIIKSIKLLSIAGAYWRANKDNKQLTRIYGISFPKQKYLTEYLARIEEAKKRDHRKIGKELKIFAFSNKVGQGLPLWLPRGVVIREELENFMRGLQKKAGYEQVISPHIGSKELYETSGHYEKYGADSFQPIETPSENETFLLKPMNCPHHCEIYKAEKWSYKDLPKRYAEFGTVYRYEQSGELHGLTRVRGFTQDDAHIFCTSEQLNDEFKKVIDLVLYVFTSLSFENFKAQVSLRDPNTPEKYIGSEENWQIAEQAIINAVKEKNLPYEIEYGEAAFYGPKLDFMVRDALNREWQLGTIQVDYNLPERFKLEYKGADNEQHRPVMIHRAPFGSLERFIAILLEHTVGELPLWLAPEQVLLIPVSEKYEKYADKVGDLLKNNDIRTLFDKRSETVGKKIREAVLNKYPYVLIVGEKEEKSNTVSVRQYKNEEIKTCTIDDFVSKIKKQITLELSKKV